MVSRIPPEDFEPGPSSAEHLNQLPRGWITEAVRSSDSSNTNTSMAILETDEVTLSGDRRYEVKGIVTIRSASAGGVHVALHQNGSQIQRMNDTTAAVNKNIAFSIHTEIEPNDGDYVFGLIIGNTGGGNNVQSRADGFAGDDGETCLSVHDIGPAASGS